MKGWVQAVALCMQLAHGSDTAQSLCCSPTPSCAPAVRNSAPEERETGFELLLVLLMMQNTNQHYLLEMKRQFSTEVLSFCICNKRQFSKGWSIGFFIKFKYYMFYIQE